MKSLFYYLFFLAFLITSCQPASDQATEQAGQSDDNTEAFVWQTERVADLGILRYKVHGFDRLSLDQKKLVYYLYQAGLSGRDIMYDQNYRHNLAIRNAIDEIIADNKHSNRSGDEWEAFMTYAKRVWFSNGIHHHYSNDKFKPGFSRSYFEDLLQASDLKLEEEIMDVIFDPQIDALKVNQDPTKDLVKASAVNFYGPKVTEDQVDTYYQKMIDRDARRPIAYGLNSRLVLAENGSTLEEQVYRVDGLYGPAIKEIVKWLKKATEVAENEKQKEALELLIEYYETGDLETWDEYNVAWVSATEGDVDYINGFIEVYNDPKGYTGSYETIVQIKDFEASERMKKVAENAEYFEKNSPIMEEHKKEDVVGITYNVVTVAGESGDAAPSTPIGVNLPNSNWIRKEHGSKSVSLGNIIEAYNNASGPGLLNEFAHDPSEVERAEKYGQMASKMHTALHEVIGHASGQLEPGVGTPKETLRNYASPLEEARADLVSLYFITDPKLVDLGLIDNLEVGYTEYDQYLKNGYMLQLRRIEPGRDIQQAHMRNRQAVSSWVIEKGQQDGSIEIVKRDGKTYIDIKDYEKVREHFGTLLREVQRMKSQGDYAATRRFFENYGVKVNKDIHQEVLKRAEPLNIPPYYGFINPEYEVEYGQNDEIVDIRVTYPMDFTDQMLRLGRKYGFLN